MRFYLPLSVVALWLAQPHDAFQLPTVNQASLMSQRTGMTPLFAKSDLQSNSDDDTPQSGGKRKKVLAKLKKSVAFLTPLAILGSSVGTLVATPQRANAGAPVMAMPKTKARDPVQIAMDLHEKKMMAEAQQELSDFQAKARAVEKEGGPDHKKSSQRNLW